MSVRPVHSKLRLAAVVAAVMAWLLMPAGPAGAITCVPHTSTIVCEMDDGSVVECDAGGCRAA